MREAVFHRLDRDQIVERLQCWAHDELAARQEVQEVVLIGSLARGDWSARSDADVVVVVDEADDPPRERPLRYAPAGRLGVGVELLVYTREETARWSPRFEAEVRGGLVLHRRGP